MITLALTFPSIDPVAVHLGPLAIRWYALAYIAGILLGWQLRRLPGRAAAARDATAWRLDDFLVWATIGVILGGRLGYVLFYQPDYYLGDPLEILYVWHGGMSFHGGALGVIAGHLVFARQRSIPVLAVGDIVCAVVPIGLFFGRIANFINGELYGRVSEVPWAMVFPQRRTGAAPSEPALPGRPRGAGCCSPCSSSSPTASECAATSRPDQRRVPGRLCDRAQHRRAVPRAGRVVSGSSSGR